MEQVPKVQLEACLRDATRDTLKGEYHKIKHASKLLGLINMTTVRNASRHCDRFFATLQAKMQ